MRAHEPASFWRVNTIARENVVVTETSHQLLEVLSFFDQERALPLSLKKTVLGKFAREKRKMKLSGMSIFLRIREKYLKSNFDFLVELVPESEGL